MLNRIAIAPERRRKAGKAVEPLKDSTQLDRILDAIRRDSTFASTSELFDGAQSSFDDEEWADVAITAVGRNNRDVFNRAVTSLKDVNFVGSWGNSVLHAAAFELDEISVRLLVARGADVNQVCKGAPVLMSSLDSEIQDAIQANHKEGRRVEPLGAVSSFLVEAGADPYVRNANGTSPLDCAKKNGHKIFLQAVQRHHGKT